MQSLLPIRLILLSLLAGCRVNFLQFANGERRLLRILSFIFLLEIRKFRLPFHKLCNDQSHLISPVSQMDISQNLMPHLSRNTLHTFSDDRGAQMSHMQRFRHIGAAVVHQDHPGILHLLKSQILIFFHLI